MNIERKMKDARKREKREAKRAKRREKRQQKRGDGDGTQAPTVVSGTAAVQHN
jgi:hypothetical protein